MARQSGISVLAHVLAELFVSHSGGMHRSDLK